MGLNKNQKKQPIKTLMMKQKVRFTLLVNVKNEDEILKEFLHFYLLMGFDRIIVYDNDSDFPVSRFVVENIRNNDWKSRIIVVPLSGEKVKTRVYEHYQKHFGQFSEWTMFLDADEFLATRNEMTISKIVDIAVRQHRDVVGCIALNWLMFGAGGVEKKPQNQLAIETFTMGAANLSNYIKCIARNDAVISWRDPHHPVLKSEFRTVDTCGKMLDPHRQAMSWNVEPTQIPFDHSNPDSLFKQNAVLFHYWVQSYETFAKRRMRPRDHDATFFFNHSDRDNEQIVRQLFVHSDREHGVIRHQHFINSDIRKKLYLQ